MNDPQIDRLQFDLHELTQRVELLERVAPAMPDEVSARLDRLCREMTQFQLEVLELLSKMAPQAPAADPAARPAPVEESSTPSLEGVPQGSASNSDAHEEIPDISVGWIGSARTA